MKSVLFQHIKNKNKRNGAFMCPGTLNGSQLNITATATSHILYATHTEAIWPVSKHIYCRNFILRWTAGWRVCWCESSARQHDQHRATPPLANDQNCQPAD